RRQNYHICRAGGQPDGRLAEPARVRKSAVWRARRRDLAGIKTGYEDPIVGELIKTGFGVMYKRNYDNLKELLSKPKKKKKITE
ncbi:MAG TPA: hypothetical protein VLB84_19575, partial [Bacteroidia bacterium]|nr:hypothetical protein [Bacteroidia bacterium]